jgi:uncharacterized protein (TIGR03437 family)
MRHSIVLLFSFAASSQVATGQVPLAATLSPITVPPGGVAQLQFFLTSPLPLNSGAITITLDPTVFGSIIAADAYSVTGDQYGEANIVGNQVGITFGSPEGGIGRSPNLPILTITAPVLATAKIGTNSIPALAANLNEFDVLNRSTSSFVDYTLSLTSGAVTIGGSLSVSSVQPLGSILPAGSVVTISGTGFTSNTSVQIDDVALSDTQYVSPQQINITLAAPANLEFHGVTVQDGGASIVFFPVLHGSFLAVQPIFPLQLYQAAIPSSGGYLQTCNIAVQNPTLEPVAVTIFGYGPDDPVYGVPTPVAVQPGTTYLRVTYPINESTTYLISTAPVRVVTTTAAPGYMGELDSNEAQPAEAFLLPPAKVDAFPDSVTWNATTGGAAAPPVDLIAISSYPATFTASASTASGGPWLTLSSQQGAACVVLSITPGLFNYNTACAATSQITASAASSNLSPGTYTGSITLVQQGANAVPTVIPVVLTVSSLPASLTTSFNPTLNYLPDLSNATPLPLVAAVLNGASQSAQPLSPGEIVTIFGQNFGPPTPAGAILTSSGASTANNGVQVFFGSTAAPLLYVSSTQINAVVPSDVTGPATALTVNYNGQSIPAGSFSVAASSPGIFTQGSTGVGEAAVLNQDNSVNTPANAATRGSVIQVYATGAGVPAIPVSLTIGGVSATITYAGSAPGLVSGVLQVNAVVPEGVAPGPAIPIVLAAGTARSQTGVTIAIQ